MDCHNCFSLLDAVSHKHLKCLKHFRNQGEKWDESTIALAARRGSLDIVEYLNRQGCPWDEKVYKEAAFHSRVGILKYAYHNKCPRGSLNVAAIAAGAAKVSCLHYARIVFGWDAHVYVEAIRHGRLENLKYAHTYACPPGVFINVAAIAVQFEQLECFRYAIGVMDAPHDVDVCFEAARLNRLDFLILAREKEYPWDKSVAFIAASRGHYAMFVHLVENGCPYDYQKCFDNRGKDEHGRSIPEYLESLEKPPPPSPPIPSVLNMSCSICVIGSKSIAYVPCGHVLSCAACAERLSNCPYCRTPLTDKLKLYFV